MNYKALLIIPMLVLCQTASADEPKYITDCFGCHGKLGVSTQKEIPTIAGLSAVFIEESLLAYIDEARPAKSGPYYSGDLSRPDTDMKTISKGLSEAQITAISAYFAKQKFVPVKQTFDKKLAAIGKRIHAMKCEKCHESAGSLPDDDAGLLAGQWTPYLKNSFAEYRDKSRETNKKMRKLLLKMTDRDIEALLHFYASNEY
jgi:sulfide dehydrogenase cytochrome subunit